MKRLLLMVACVLIMAGPTLAGNILILNPSFEDNVLSDGGVSSAATNWITGNGGAWNPTDGWPTGQPYIPPGGDNVVWVNDGSLYQDLAAILTGNTTYTLKSYVGHHPAYFDPTGMPAYAVQLLAYDSVSGSEHLLTQISGQDPGWANWGQFEATYTAAVGDPYLGETLRVRLIGNTQVNFDVVSLDATAVPLPPGLLLLGSGLLGLAGWRRFRKS
jgi:hypothetical protein